MLLGMAASWKEEPSRVCMRKGDDSEGELQCECYDPTTVCSSMLVQKVSLLRSG